MAARTEERIMELVDDLIEELGQDESGDRAELVDYLQALREAKSRISDAIDGALDDMKNAGIADPEA